MPYGLYFSIAGLGIFVAAALWPPQRPRVLANITYILGMVINEIPHYGALLLVIWLGISIVSGDFGTPADITVAVVLTALVAAGLFALGWRARTSRTIVAAALRDAGIEPARSSNGHATRRGWQITLFPFAVRPRSVVRERNVSYGPHRKQQLDVYYRKDRPTGGPTLLYLHGGGYFLGSKHHEARGLLYRFADRGWVCVSANYRLRPRAGFLDHMVDAKRALAWLHEHAGDYGGDGRRVVMSGSSAGAHMSSISALSQQDPRYQPGFESADTSVSAVVGLYGYYGPYYGDDWNAALPSSPLVMDASSAPPFFLTHGTVDNNASVENSRELAAKLRAEAPTRPVYAELPGAQHGFDLVSSWRFEAILDGIQDFTDAVLPVSVNRR